MGMSIDMAITVLGMVEAHGICIEAKDIAVDTMRKYQKIQEIARWNNAPSPYYKPDGELFREIVEVIGDGND